MKPFTATINGKRYRIEFVACSRDAYGECTAPGYPQRTIRIDRSLTHPDRDNELLTVVLHEALHAADWDRTEEWVDRVSQDLARLLKRMGYKREED